MAFHIVGRNISERIDGTNREDWIWAYDGDDYVHAGAGNDIIWGGRGGDWLYGGADIDALYGEDGRDLLYGEAGKDTLYGGADVDYLNGGSEADVLYGGEGDDILHGDAHDDTLIGGKGVDRLKGDEGADTFKFFASDIVIEYEWVGSVGPFETPTIRAREFYEMDLIQDFEPARDCVHLGSLLYSETDFDGVTARDAIDQGYIYFGTSSSDSLPNTKVYIDRDGGAHDSTEDLAIVHLAGARLGELDWDNFIV
jgi:Ca2+-binding RTX toxin-like protein